MTDKTEKVSTHDTLTEALIEGGLSDNAKRLIESDPLFAQNAARVLNEASERISKFRAQQQAIVAAAFVGPIDSIGLAERFSIAADELRALGKSITVHAISDKSGISRGRATRFMDKNRAYAKKIGVEGYE